MGLRNLVALLAVVAVLGVVGAARVEAAPAALASPDVDCQPTGARVTFRWTPAAGALEQWLDVSTRNDSFAGQILSVQLDAAAERQVVNNIRVNAPHFWRINTRTAAAWEPSVTANFTPCAISPRGGAAPSPADDIYTFGDDVPESDRDKVRRAVGFALRQASAEGDFPLPRVYAYSTPDQLAEAMSVCVNETAALTQFRAIWVNSGTIAVAFTGNFFIYAGGPHWRDVSLAQVVQTVAHEYFHVLQRELTKFPGSPQTDPTMAQVKPNCLGSGQDRGPTWLTEGSAELFGWLTVAEAANVDLGVIRQAYAQTNFEGRLQDLEEQLRFRSSSGHSYPLGFMATDYASKGKIAPVFQYYRLVGKGTPWKDAFHQAFGITIDYFYEQFEAFKANGYK